MIAPFLSIHEEVLPAVRGLISNSPEPAYCAAETIAELLYVGRFLSYRPTIFAVEAVPEALRLGSEIAT
jgi:hypothetical protein